ncbi:hypothetical protein Cgig2_001421 [Carnegiea gigantea]|uniref:Serine carboxypeptidase-like 45 n=1 Tax=Carnegiea gigantea TaxID=171969 RepID=A0A9Q1KTW0_9CARY|nr:hypothetical protein Cgig2_001421 [Carnegiea gigantea]
MLSLKLLILSTTLVLCNLPKITASSSSSSSSSENDKITSLPGQPSVNFQQYAGYIAVDAEKQRNLFYYLVEAETNPASKPLVLWLNGGPGCSSVGAGAFTENGPFRPSGDVLLKNDYSWNQEANMLYLESPVGVGFSYSTNRSFYDTLDDEKTGHYIPQLANLILRSTLKSNLKGVADEVKVNVCQEDETTKYLNRKDVQNSMHAQLVGVTQWGICSDVIRYNLDGLEVPTIPLLGTLTKAGVRVLIFSGDQDSVIPLIGTRLLVKNLAKELELNTTVPYRFWLQDKQVGGWTEGYGDILTYATVRGAAHEAPFSQPARSLVLFGSFVQGKPLPDSPSIPR